jgi:hypothetical protein
MGFVEKIFTGNHKFSHFRWSFPVIFSQKNQSIESPNKRKTTEMAEPPGIFVMRKYHLGCRIGKKIWKIHI